MIFSTNQAKPPLLRHKSLFAAPVIYLIIMSQSILAAEANKTTEQDEERWFEVEVILYKPKSIDSTNNESWNKEVQLNLPENLQDFLQPYGILEPETLDESIEELVDGFVDDDASLQTDDTLTNSFVSETDIKISTLPIISSESQFSSPNAFDNSSPEAHEAEFNLMDDFIPEKPFLALDSESFRLIKEAKNIEKSHKYQLLAHFAWRQPVFDKQAAIPVRIAGGFDYQDTFEYSGDKKVILEPVLPAEAIFSDEVNQQSSLDGQKVLESSLESLPIEEIDNELTQTNDINLTDDNKDIATEQNDLADAENNLEQNVTGNTQDTPTEPAIVALPWVPEIDGSLIVFIYRNYLHVNTDMFYRLPAKEEVETFGLNSIFENSENSFDAFNSSLTETTTEVDQPIRTDLSQSDLVWQYDDNFLLEEPQKNYRERLFNYPLKQKRRMRSTELHYFDHPLLGMLVVITPYENQPQEPANDIEQTQ